MASFKTHISFGAIVGGAITIIALVYSLVSNNALLPILFFAAVLGSFLPDFDSDEGLPFQIIFGLFALVGAGLAFFYFYQRNPHDYKILIIAASAAFIIIRFLFGALAKKFTQHRGIFHSLPAMLISAFGALLIVNHFNLIPLEKISIAGAVGLGFLSHLILDEAKAAVNFRGIIFSPKRSLGSSLKLFSKSKLVNVITYGLLLILIYLNLPIIKSILEKSNGG